MVMEISGQTRVTLAALSRALPTSKDMISWDAEEFPIKIEKCLLGGETFPIARVLSVGKEARKLAADILGHTQMCSGLDLAALDAKQVYKKVRQAKSTRSGHMSREKVSSVLDEEGEYMEISVCGAVRGYGTGLFLLIGSDWSFELDQTYLNCSRDDFIRANTSKGPSNRNVNDFANKTSGNRVYNIFVSRTTGELMVRNFADLPPPLVPDDISMADAKAMRQELSRIKRNKYLYLDVLQEESEREFSKEQGIPPPPKNTI